MNKFKHFLLAGTLAAASTTASAGLIDFPSLIEGAGGYGESAWTTLNITDAATGIDVSLTAGYYDAQGVENDAFVYLDWGNAGVGVCKEIGDAGSVYNTASKEVDTKYSGSGTNMCAPAGDDNVTGDDSFTEFLDITFSQGTLINFTLNNNHDGGFDADDYAVFVIDAVEIPVLSSGDFINYEMTVSAGQTVRVMFGNEEFYVDTISVPEPAMFSLLGLGLLGFGFARRARKA